MAPLTSWGISGSRGPPSPTNMLAAGGQSHRSLLRSLCRPGGTWSRPYLLQGDSCPRPVLSPPLLNRIAPAGALTIREGVRHVFALTKVQTVPSPWTAEAVESAMEPKKAPAHHLGPFADMLPHVAVVSLNLDGTVAGWNETCEAVSGQSAETVPFTPHHGHCFITFVCYGRAAGARQTSH